MAVLPSPVSDPVGSCYRFSSICAGFLWPGLSAWSRSLSFSGETVRGCRPEKLRTPAWHRVDSLLGTVAFVLGREGGKLGGDVGVG